MKHNPDQDTPQNRTLSSKDSKAPVMIIRATHKRTSLRRFLCEKKAAKVHPRTAVRRTYAEGVMNVRKSTPRQATNDLTLKHNPRCQHDIIGISGKSVFGIFLAEKSINGNSHFEIVDVCVIQSRRHDKRFLFQISDAVDGK